MKLAKILRDNLIAVDCTVPEIVEHRKESAFILVDQGQVFGGDSKAHVKAVRETAFGIVSRSGLGNDDRFQNKLEAVM